MSIVQSTTLAGWLLGAAVASLFLQHASAEGRQKESRQHEHLPQAIVAAMLDEANLRAEAKRWRRDGYPDIPVEALPAEVRDMLGVTEGTIPPEVFFTIDVQSAMFAARGGVPALDAEETDPAALIELWRRNGWPDMPATALPAKVREALGIQEDTIPPEVFFGPQVQEALAEHGAPVPQVVVDEAIVDVAHPSVSHQDMEMLRQAVEQDLGPGTVIVTSPELLRAFEEHAGDEAALRAAIEKAIPSLPLEMRQSLKAGFNIELEDIQGPRPAATQSLEPDWLPTQPVLERISSESRAALAPHRDLLDDRWELIRMLPELPPRTRRAAEEFLGRQRKPVPIASLYSEEALRTIERAKERGYFEAHGAPMGTQLLASIDQSEILASEDVAGGVHWELDDYLARHPDLPTIPATHIEPESRNYVVAVQGASSQIYSRSSFGPVLHVQESNASEFQPHVPNLTIAGNDGTVTWTKHDTGAWTTTVSGFNGRKVFHITVEAQLEGAQRDRFVEMARSVIESGHGF